MRGINISTYRIGIVGIGFIADFHFNAFKKASSVEIAGITRDYYGSNTQREEQYRKLQQKANALGITCYDNFDSMVEDKTIDALVVTSVNNLHYTQIKKGIENNKHLLVEKPVLIYPEHYAEIETLAIKKKIHVFPGHNFAYRGAVRKAKEIIDSGTLGSIVYASFVSAHRINDIHAHGWRSLKDIAAGGALIDSGHHQVYQSIYLMGLPESLQAFKSKIHYMHMECEDTAVVNLKYPAGAVGTIMQSWASDDQAGANAIRIIGKNGSIAISDALYHNGDKISEDVSFEHSFDALAIAFTNCLEKGTEPVSNLDDSANTLKIVYSAYKSAEKNIVVNF